MQRQAQVLIVGSDSIESLIVERVLRSFAEIDRVNGASEMALALETGDFDVVFCEHRDSRSAGLLNQMQRLRPDLPVIVFSRTAGEREWLESLEAGAFDLVGAPFESTGIRSVLEHAMATCEGRRLHHAAACC
jgi:DNA-binding NtrC family response regulator